MKRMIFYSFSMVKVVLSYNEIPMDKKVVLDFFATWCTSCKKIYPQFEEMEANFKNIEFIKIDVDEGEDISTIMDIKSLPTFIFMENGKEVDRMEGSGVEVLREKLMKLDNKKKMD